MKLRDIEEYVSRLHEKHNNNEWLPSPFEINDYIAILESKYPDEMGLLDELYEFYERAFEQ